MSRLQQLAARRANLIDLAAQQRIKLGELSRQLERPASIFDKGYAVVRSVRSHPKLVLAGFIAVFFLRKRISIGKLTKAALTAARLGISVAKMLPSRKSLLK